MSIPAKLLGLGLTLLSACASTPESARPQRVCLSYRNGPRFELVNETHTGRVEQYSEVRRDASRKVQTDEVMAGLVDVLRKNGFEAQARAGPAPREFDERSFMALEIEDGDRLEHVLGYKGMPADQHKQLLALSQSFVDVFNLTFGLQAVEIQEGETPFENPVGPTRTKPPKVPVGKG